MNKFFHNCLICVLICFFSFALVACNEVLFTKNDISSLYLSMKTNEDTSQFFDGNTFVVNFDDVIEVDIETDKSYIFSLVYDKFLFSASALMSGVIDRVGQIDYAVKDFSISQQNEIYLKLSVVNDCLKNLSDNKTVFEASSGNLHYKNVLSSYNNLLKSLFDLNALFANYYFVENVGLVNFNFSSLTNSNVRDMIRYQNFLVSRVSFYYELLNFESTNPMGDINEWFLSTEILGYYVSLCGDVKTKLSNSEDLASHIGSDSSSVLNLFKNMQSEEIDFFSEYNIFFNNLSGFDFKNYFKSTNKSAFFLDCSLEAQSHFRLVSNFISGRYLAYYNGFYNVLLFI